MKLAIHPGCTLRPLSLAALLLAALSAPLAADEMWQAVFDEHLENARGGDSEAQYEIGIMYLKGQGVEQDRKQAVQWLKAAEDSGHTLAATKLARIEEQESRFRELKELADDGDTGARYEVAMMYLKGRGVRASGRAALRYLHRAADAGDTKAIARLGIILHKGEAGETDHREALKLLQSVSAESVLAQYYLGEIYASGAGVEQDYTTAIDWYRKAAAGGFNRARGKIINLEEEIKVEQRRKDRLARAAEQRRQSAARAADREAERRAALARKAQQRHQAAAKARQALEAVAAKPTAPGAEAEPLDRLTRVRWLRDKRPVDYLPSQVTECDRDEEGLVCLSEVRQRTAGTKLVEYRVKSIIRTEDDSYTIVYRNLVLDVTDTQEPDDEPLGYDDQVSQGYHIKTGWTPEHRVVCRHAAEHRMDCDKDDRYQITLVGEN